MYHAFYMIFYIIIIPVIKIIIAIKVFFIIPQDALLENVTVKRIPPTMKIHQVILQDLLCTES